MAGPFGRLSLSPAARAAASLLVAAVLFKCLVELNGASILDDPRAIEILTDRKFLEKLKNMGFMVPLEPENDVFLSAGCSNNPDIVCRRSLAHHRKPSAPSNYGARRRSIRDRDDYEDSADYEEGDRYGGVSPRMQVGPNMHAALSARRKQRQMEEAAQLKKWEEEDRRYVDSIAVIPSIPHAKVVVTRGPKIRYLPPSWFNPPTYHPRLPRLNGYVLDCSDPKNCKWVEGPIQK